MAGPPLWSGDLTACENGAAATWGLSISRGAFMNPGGGAFNIALSVTTAGKRVLADTVEAVELGNNLFSAASPDVRISVATMAPPEIG
jgi:hypothetical protein